jgi:hypothetical protein
MNTGLPESMTLRELLDACCDRNSSRWEKGWLEFLRRYKSYIYNCSVKSCSVWNMPRLKMQFSDAVNDVVSDVIYTLCKNDFQSLQNYVARDQEPQFLAWLATVCRRAAGHYIRKHFTDKMIDGDYEDLKQCIGHLPFDAQWELREYIVTMLRNAWSGSRHQVERDILLFQLHALADFPLSMITALPCLESVGLRVIDNVAHRMRQQLRMLRTSSAV